MAARVRKATRKKTTRKKATRKKTTRKTTARGATRKKATRKKAARPAARRKTAGKKTARRAARGGLDLELPVNLRAFQRDMTRRIRRLEASIARARKETRLRLAKLLSEAASRQLGWLEAMGERAWHRLSAPYRRELLRLLRRLERAVAAA
jgi:hypothetical protein